MRGRNIKYFFDTFMWYLLYLLPLFLLVFAVFRTGTIPSLSSVFTDLGVTIFNDNVILTCLTDIFGASGVFPLFNSDGVLVYATYFICVYLVHLAVDFLIFIPRLFENIADKFTKNGGQHYD